MKIDKLPNKSDKVVFITKGSFFCCKSTLVDHGEGSLSPTEVSLERISRYSDFDFLKTIENQKATILFSKYPLGESFEGEYIEEEDQVDSTNIEVLKEALGGERVIIVGMDFNKITALDLNSLRHFKIEMQTIRYTNVNEIFDPFWVKRNPPKFSKDVHEFLEALDMNEYDRIVLTGELCWANLGHHLVNLLSPHGVTEGDIVMDELGTIEALLYANLRNTTLRFIDAEIFKPSIAIRHKLKYDLEVENMVTGINRKFYIEGDEPKEIVIKQDEKFVSDDIGEAKILLLNGARVSGNTEKYQKRPLVRKDVLNTVEEKKLTLESLVLRGNGIKIPADTQLSILQAQRVKKGEVLGVRKKGGGILKEEIVSKIDGVVDLDYIDYGWIFFREQKTYQKHTNLTHDSVLKIRPREIFGPERTGVLNVNIIYSDRFDIDNYLDHIKSGIEVYIVRSISLKDYNAIAFEMQLTDLCSVVVLEGIDLELGGNFLLDDLKESIVQINNKRKEMVIGLPAKAKFTADKMKEKELKQGEVVRIIDEKDWGNYAKIISIGKENVKCEINGAHKEVSLLNIL